MGEQLLTYRCGFRQVWWSRWSEVHLHGLCVLARTQTLTCWLALGTAKCLCAGVSSPAQQSQVH